MSTYPNGAPSFHSKHSSDTSVVSHRLEMVVQGISVFINLNLELTCSSSRCHTIMSSEEVNGRGTIKDQQTSKLENFVGKVTVRLRVALNLRLGMGGFGNAM